jgi:hypothetical protein
MQPENPTDTDKPPFFKSWRAIYGMVMGALLLQIIIYYAITVYFG